MSSNLIDMSTGSPTKHLLKFALPLLIGNVFQQFYNMVDSIVVGNFVGPDAIAAVGTCGSMNFFCFSLSAGLAIGIGIIVAQFFGAKDFARLRSTIANSIYVLGLAALIVSLLGFFLSPYVLRLLRCPEAILGDAVIYMKTTCVGIVFIVLYNGVASILRALGDSKSPLYFLIIASIINLILDLLFVLVFKLAVFGVALATIISQAISGITSLIYAHKKIEYFRLSKKDLRPDIAIIKSSFKLSLPIAMQNCLISISMMVLQQVVNTFGASVMASYTIIMRIEQLIQQPFSSLGAAITTFSGQNIGANKIDRVRKGFNRGTVIALIFSLFVLVIFQIFANQIVYLFVKESEVIRIGAIGLRITSFFYFALGMIYVPRAVLNGTGDTGFAMINGMTEVFGRIVFSHLLVRIPAIVLFGRSIPVGFWGIWLTTCLTWTITAIVCVIRYKSGIWYKKSVKANLQ
ncbi:MAG: MATE family efflux transporter [Treponema sp.]|nr:MATE family efflux transporter [Treponema sp.]